MVQMDLGIMYAIVAFVCVVISSVLLNRTVATPYKETIDNQFVKMITFVITFSIIDGIWGIFFSSAIPTPLLGYKIFTYAFHTMAAWSAYVWFGYAIYFTKTQGTLKLGLEIARKVLIFLQMILIFSNIPTRFFFTITDDYQYIPGTGRTVAFLLQFSYYVFLMLFALVMTIFSRDGRKKYNVAAIYASIPLIFGLGQLAFPDAPMYSIGFMLSVLIIYCFNISTERDDYFKEIYKKDNLKLTTLAQGLAGDYEAIYYVDILNGSYDSFGSRETFNKNVLNRMTDTNDFFQDIVDNLETVVYEEDRDLVMQRLSKKNIIKEFLSKDSFSFNYRMLIDEEPIFFQMRVAKSKVEGEENRFVIGVYNVDDDVNLEIERQKTLETALQNANQANEAKTAFLFNMSHDIRTPMNAIFGFAEIAEKNINDERKVRESIEKIKVAGTHLLQLINEVLDMSRVESGKVSIDLEPDDLNDLKDRISSIIGLTASEKGIALNTKIINLSDPKVYIDKLHFSQIMINILSNSVKYTNPGGKIDVTLEQLPSDRAEYGLYKFVIADNGVGMSKKFLKELFEPFSREETVTNSGIEGTGLGMSITKRMVDLFQGSIDVESEKGVGTTTTIILPLKKCEKTNIKKIADVEVENNRIISGKHVLVAEDNELNVEIVLEFLNELGITADVAKNGEEAIHFAREADDGKYAAILMDVQMPKMNGYEATEYIRSIGTPYLNAVPIIAMTANAFVEDKQKAFSVGMNAHIGKPISIDTLSATLQKYAL